MEPFLGTIQLFGFLFPPKGWMTCEGQTLSIAEHTTLYSLLGDRYGGDGRVTFALPNLKGAEPLPNMIYYIAITGQYPPRS